MSVTLDRRNFLLTGTAAALSAPSRALKCVISLFGYNDIAEMLSALNAAFTKRHPGVRIITDLPGTRSGPDALASGRSTLAPMGARFTPAQRAAFVKATQSEPEGFRVAHASLSPKALSGPNALIVHRENPLRVIDLDFVARLFTHGGPHLWSEAQVAGALANRPIVLTGLSPETPLALEFRDAAFPSSNFRIDYRGFGQSRDVIDFIGRDPAAFGFAALNRCNEGVRALGIKRRASSSPVTASPKTLREGLYPLDRHLWLYARRDSCGRLDVLARSYLAFVLSSQGQAIVGGGSLGYLALGERERRRELAKL